MADLKLDVCTYICIVKLEEAIQTHSFTSEKQKSVVHLMFTVYQLKSNMNAMLKLFNITGEQYNVLRILRGKHPAIMCVKDIGGRMIERSSNVPRIVDRLVVKKMVKRTQGKEDRRETAIGLTQKGIEVLENCTAKLEEFHQNNIAIDETEAARLNGLLEKINSILP